MANSERIKDSADRALPLRVWRRRGRARGSRRVESPSIRVKCGCCDEAVVIYFDEEKTGDASSDTLEINGVSGTVDQWKKVFLPLLGIHGK